VAGWFTIPATFTPHEIAESRGGVLPPLIRPDSVGGSEATAQVIERRGMEQRDPAAALRAFQRANALHGDPVAALRALRDTPDAFGEEPPALHPATSNPLRAAVAYVASDSERWLGTAPVGSGECVSLLRQATGAPHTLTWHRGPTVKGNLALRPGTAIATFDDDGRYGNHTDGRSHAAIYLGQDARGLRVIDQWRGHSPTERIIRFNDKRPAVDNGNRSFVVN
jgi:hypothetical protein